MEQTTINPYSEHPFGYIFFCFFVTFAVALIVTLSHKFDYGRQFPWLFGKPKQHWIHDVAAFRVGGAVILVGPLLSIGLFQEDMVILQSLLLSAIPIFVSGICEDIGVETPPKFRLVAGCISGGIAIYLLDAWLTSLRIPPIDLALAFSPVAILFTIVICSVLAQCFNLVDGMNGLSSGLGFLALAGGIVLTLNHENFDLALTISLLAASILGFWIVNITFGRIFLGDAGAYLIGHLVAWSTIIISKQQHEVSPWALLLLVIYPVAETATTVFRRINAKKKIMAADREHLHHLMLNLLMKKLKDKALLAHAIASMILLCLTLPAIAVAVLFWSNTFICMTSCIIFVFVFFLLRWRLANKSGA